MVSSVSRYAAVHESPQGPGDARPTALQIITDENCENTLEGKVILITGCSSGIGVETARALCYTGATLYLTARDLPKAKFALGSLIESPRVHLIHLDMNSLDSVHACAEEFKSKSKSLNILIENAGVMACPEERKADRFEKQFGTNHLAHFLLFYLLKSVLLSSTTPAYQSRVIILSSCAHKLTSVHLDNLNLGGEYDPFKAYDQSKTANIWTANHIERLYGSQGLHAFSLHPGAIATEILRHVSDDKKAEWAKNDHLNKYWKKQEQGAATTVWAPVSRDLEGIGGKFLDDCQIAPQSALNDPYGPGYASWAYDSPAEAKLWERTLELLKLKDKFPVDTESPTASLETLEFLGKAHA